jgi:iron complex transport system ATP-binding protein
MGRHPHTRGRFFEGPEDLAATEAALYTAGVAGVADKLVHTLSGGERQRVLVARALAQQPTLLLMDEPNAHLDLHHQVALGQLIRRLNREEGTTVVLVSHDLNLSAELSDRLLLLAKGRVARLGTPEDVLDATLIEAVYGCRVWIEPNPKTGRPRVQVQWTEALPERVSTGWPP